MRHSVIDESQALAGFILTSNEQDDEESRGVMMRPRSAQEVEGLARARRRGSFSRSTPLIASLDEFGRLGVTELLWVCKWYIGIDTLDHRDMPG